VTDRRLSWRLAALVVLIAIGIAVAVTIGVPSLEQLRTRIAGRGPWAGVAFASAHAVVTLSPLPKAVFTVAAGALFGVPAGLIVVVAGATVGAVVAFSLARCLGRDAVRSVSRLRVNRFDEQLADRGLWAALATRLVPVVPFTAVNYLAGLTTVRKRDFVLGTVIGILPATTAYVVLASYGRRPGSWPFWAALAALTALIIIGAGASWLRRRAAADG
jgi:uncharacterized membrane protein YdjX (TVP38/TMEM64 family)